MRRRRGDNGTIIDSLNPNPPCFTMSLPSRLYPKAETDPRRGVSLRTWTPLREMGMRTRLCGTGPHAPFRYTARGRVLPAWRSNDLSAVAPKRLGDGHSFARARRPKPGRSSPLRSSLASLVRVNGGQPSLFLRQRGLPAVALCELKRTKSEGGRSSKEQTSSISSICLSLKEFVLFQAASRFSSVVEQLTCNE